MVSKGGAHKLAGSGVQSSGSNHSIIEHFIKAEAISLSHELIRLLSYMLERRAGGWGEQSLQSTSLFQKLPGSSAGV